MAYDEYFAERISRILMNRKVVFEGRKMMGGFIFLVDQKMLCGIHIDKKYGDSLLMARIGEDAYEDALAHEHTLPMDFTGRPMKGYVFITPEGCDDDDRLEYWIEQCLVFNPLAKASPRKKN